MSPVTNSTSSPKSSIGGRAQNPAGARWHGFIMDPNYYPILTPENKPIINQLSIH